MTGNGNEGLAAANAPLDEREALLMGGLAFFATEWAKPGSDRSHGMLDDGFNRLYDLLYGSDDENASP